MKIDDFNNTHEFDFYHNPILFVIDTIENKKINQINNIINKAIIWVHNNKVDSIILYLNNERLKDFPQIIFIGDQYDLVRLFAFRVIKNKKILDYGCVLYLSDVENSDAFKLLLAKNVIHWIVELDKCKPPFKPTFWFESSVKALQDNQGIDILKDTEKNLQENKIPSLQEYIQNFLSKFVAITSKK